MEALFYLIPAALLLGIVGLICFVWALRSGQFEDLDGAAYRVLHDSHDDASGHRDQPSQEAPDQAPGGKSGDKSGSEPKAPAGNPSAKDPA
jgi:cbb3-type cytochrome oxidase maturation protein